MLMKLIARARERERVVRLFPACVAVARELYEYTYGGVKVRSRLLEQYIFLLFFIDCCFVCVFREFKFWEGAVS